MLQAVTEKSNCNLELGSLGHKIGNLFWILDSNSFISGSIFVILYYENIYLDTGDYRDGARSAKNIKVDNTLQTRAFWESFFHFHVYGIERIYAYLQLFLLRFLITSQAPPLAVTCGVPGPLSA